MDNMIQKILRFITVEMIMSGNPNISGMIDYLDIDKKDVKAVYNQIKEEYKKQIKVFKSVKSLPANDPESEEMDLILELHINAYKKKLKHLEDILLVSMEVRDEGTYKILHSIWFRFRCV